MNTKNYVYVARGGTTCPPYVSRQFKDDQGRLHSDFVGDFNTLKDAREFADKMNREIDE
jgi:hypothetical protein